MDQENITDSRKINFDNNRVIIVYIINSRQFFNSTVGT